MNMYIIGYWLDPVTTNERNFYDEPTKKDRERSQASLGLSLQWRMDHEASAAPDSDSGPIWFEESAYQPSSAHSQLWW